MKVKITPILMSGIVGLVTVAIIPIVALGDRSETGEVDSALAQKSLFDRTRLITVKIFGEESWGSGIIIEREGAEYTVLTNDHVLRNDVGEYQIETADGQIHLARPEAVKFEHYDLAIIKFSSAVEYAVATLGNSDSLQEGEKVVAGGFPFGDKGLKYTEGQIGLILAKSLVDGYQIGYTNEIEKGMSGGPVLNLDGEVIAINGIHAHPLWGEPYLYEDGEQPSGEMGQRMKDYSWAIPINKFSQIALGAQLGVH